MSTSEDIHREIVLELYKQDSKMQTAMEEAAPKLLVEYLVLESKDHPPTDDCPDMECMICSVRDCPKRDPLHYHHDGCPACFIGFESDQDKK